MAKKKSDIPEDRLALYDNLVDAVPGFDRLGVNMPYTAVNGYMFSMMTKSGTFGIRLSKEDQADFLEKYDSGPFKNYGSTMKDYVHVPDDLLERTDELKPYLKKAFDYFSSIEPNKHVKK